MRSKTNGILINACFLVLNVNNFFFNSNSSATERDEWLEAISKSIEEYTKKRITFNPSKSLEEVYHTIIVGLLPF